MTATLAAPGRLLHQTQFLRLWSARLTSTLSYYMMAVAIGWKIYAITGSALDLGFVGLIQFIPAVIFTLAIGEIADRYDRRMIIRIAQCTFGCAALTLIAVFLDPTPNVKLLFGAVFLIGTARAFELPASQSFVPALVPGVLLPRATAAWASANQVAVICGPAAGGFIYAVDPVYVPVLALILLSVAFTLVTLIRVQRRPPPRHPPTLKSVLAGFDYIRSKQRLLGVITLDLFVALLGGVTALLPIYAHDILHAGPSGLGLLRSAPAIGALITTVLLSHFPVERRIGAKMFTVVALYGAATMLFSLSTWLPLSMMALAILGAADSVSVVIRFSLVQIETPDEMRGRVSAINYLFVNTSNTLGEFESGALAAWLGAVASAFVGGLGSLLVAAIWMIIFPSLRAVDRYEPANTEETQGG
jgi:MFS family permease